MSVSDFFDLRGPQLSTGQGAISSLGAVVQSANARSRNVVLAFLIVTFFAGHRNKIGVAFFRDDLGVVAVTAFLALCSAV